MDIASIRKIISASSVAAVVTVSIIILVTSAEAFYGVTLEGTEDISIGYSGSTIEVAGNVELESHMHSDIRGVRLELYMCDSSGNSKTLIYSCDSLDVPAGQKILVPLTCSIPFWSLLNTMNENLGSDGSIIYFKICTSLDYVFDFLHIDADMVLSYRLADAGKTVSYSFSPLAEDCFEVYIDDLAKTLVPADMSITVSDASCSVNLSISSTGNRFTVRAETAGDIDTAIASLIDSDYTVEKVSGTWNEADTDTLLTFLHYMREIQ